MTDSNQYAYVYGHSDDLIQIEGDVRREEYANYGEPTTVDVLGATIEAEYRDDGVWEVHPIETDDATTAVRLLPDNPLALKDYTETVLVVKENDSLDRELPLDWDELQAEVGEWARENFGTEQPFWYSSKGMYEEFGELTHSDLKTDQGIRLDEDGVGADAERDAVGDIVIYCLDYLERCPYDLTVSEWEGMFALCPTDDVEEAYTEIGSAITNLHNHNPNKRGIRFSADRLFTHLRQWCEHKGYDFERCVVEAWDGTVSQRQWEAEANND